MPDRLLASGKRLLADLAETGDRPVEEEPELLPATISGVEEMRLESRQLEDGRIARRHRH